MEIIIILICSVFALAGIALWICWQGVQRFWAYLALGILTFVWAGSFVWWGAAMINVRWVDDAVMAYHQEALLRAIEVGHKHVPLVQTLPFAWRAVCPVGGYAHDFDALESRAIYHDVFGTDDLSFLPFGEDEMLLFATDGGVVSLPVRWERFGAAFQTNMRGSVYLRRLGGQGYRVSLVSHPSKDHAWQGLCFAPHEVWLSFKSL
ncbi:MAG: hypothetical protein COY40_00640 [Alphaproteobacteria bacterium CG_4_10_14_0_8_um_filter_53_9]|nr:MAG: hypothetical protein COY40_00640 [Alphaproteobacteria bacterium CG_4_10_14_0_8_um_filter_53_9]